VPAIPAAIIGIARRFPRPAPEESLLVRGATLLAVLVAVAAVALQEEFTTQAALAAAAILAGYVVSHLRRRASNWWLKTVIAALILAVARDFFTALLANPYDPRIPLVRLFLWLQVLHSFDLPARKDLKYSLASAVVLMAVGAVYARDTAFGLLLVPFALAAAAALVAMQARGGASLRMVGGAGLRLGVSVLAGAALIFALMPRGQGLRVRWLPVSPRLLWTERLHLRIVNPAYPEVDGTDPETAHALFNPQGYVGFSTFVDLRLRGVLDHTIVMRVRATQPAYWRGLAFDTYTGRGWRMADPAVDESGSDQLRIVPRLSPDESWPAGSEQVIQTFYVEADQPNVIFAAYRPFEVFFPTGTIGVDRYAGLRSPLPLDSGMIYSVISRIPAPPAALLARGHGEIPVSIRTRYLQVPEIPARVRRLAAELTAGVESPYQKAVAIRNYLQDGFRYTLQAPPLPTGSDAVDEFLFVTRQGSCEAFASALAVLLRAAGAPARFVTGYAPGTYNVFTGYYDVRNSDAHAWVEVFQPGTGWIGIEATPGFASAEDLARQPEGQWLARDVTLWVAGVVAGIIRTPMGRFPAQLPAVALAVAALTLAVCAGRVRIRPGAQVSGGVVETVYADMLRTLARRGYLRAPAMTPGEFAASLPAAVQPAALLLTRIFETYRYGHHMGDAQQQAACRRMLGQLQRDLRGMKPAARSLVIARAGRPEAFS